MEDLRKVIEEQTKALDALKKLDGLYRTKKPKERGGDGKIIRTSKVSIQGLMVKFYKTPFSNAQRMLVKPEFIKLYYKISDGEPFDLSLWEELSQAEKSFLYKIMVNMKPDASRELTERQCKEAKQFFNKLYVNENQIRLGNNSPEVFKELGDSVQELINRNMISKHTGNRVLKDYIVAVGKINDHSNIGNDES